MGLLLPVAPLLQQALHHGQLRLEAALQAPDARERHPWKRSKVRKAENWWG
jgi:hypothetical protein